MRKAVSYLLIFTGIQICGGAAVTSVWNLLSGSVDKTDAMLITSTVVVSVLTIAVFLLTRWTEVSPRWIRTRPWLVLCWSFVAALGGVLPSSWLQEQMPELPNWVEQDFDLILRNRWGYLTVGVLAPLAEEMVFRGAILKSLLERQSAWMAVSLSAVFFALIHFNPAQMPHAFLVGLLLGWMYYRTGSILPGMFYHWANNSVAYVTYNIYPSPDIRLVDIFGSDFHVLLAVVFSLLIFLPAVYQLHLWMRRAE